MVAGAIADMVGRALTWTSLSGLKKKRNIVENFSIVKRLRRFCRRRDQEPMCVEEDLLAKGSDTGEKRKAAARDTVAATRRKVEVEEPDDEWGCENLDVEADGKKEAAPEGPVTADQRGIY